MTVTELTNLLAATDTVQVLDVRTPSEFENAHIEGAFNVPLDQLHEHAGAIRHARRQVVLVCQSGRRAEQAEQLLKGSGIGNLRVLAGGMNAWIDRGMTIRRIRPRVSLERQVRMVAGSIVATGAIAALTISPLFAVVPALIGGGLVFAGMTDTCAMGMLLAKLPYNRGAASCDSEAIVRQFLS